MAEQIEQTSIGLTRDEIIQETAGLSRTEILVDLCTQLTQALSSGDCFLRATDSFPSYSAHLSVQLVLEDVDPNMSV